MIRSLNKMQKFWLFPALAALSLTTAPVARSQTAFTDVSNAAGVTYTGESYGASFGDLNGDGHVDGADLGLLLAGWGAPGIADLNGDGNVDGADLGLLLAAWG